MLYLPMKINSTSIRLVEIVFLLLVYIDAQIYEEGRIDRLFNRDGDLDRWRFMSP
jgi:hypothetical protein